MTNEEKAARRMVTPPDASRESNRLTDTPEARDYRKRSAVIKLKALRSQYADLGQPVSVERGSKDGREWENGQFEDEVDALFHRLWYFIDGLPE